MTEITMVITKTLDHTKTLLFHFIYFQFISITTLKTQILQLKAFYV